MKAYLLIADNYIKTGEDFQARATLKSIIDYAKDPKIVQLAQNKLNGM